MRRLKVGVIGVGHLGKEHARIYADLPNAELIGVVDSDPDTARAVAKKCRTQAFPDAEFLLNNAEAVSVAVPTIHHHAVAMPFLERGISVLVEKPMTFHVEEAEALCAAAAKTGAKLQVGHVERFNPGFRAIAGQNLKPLFIECHRLSPFRFRSADIGVVFDLMIHDLDIIQNLVGTEIQKIEAVGVPVISTHEDIANARVTFAGGCVANLTASRVSLKSMRRIRFFARDCYVAIDTMDKTATIYRKKDNFNEVAASLRDASKARMLLELSKIAYGDLVDIKNVKIGDEEPLKGELDSFVHSVIENRTPEVPGEDGMRAVKVAQQILEQIRNSLAQSGAPIPGID